MAPHLHMPGYIFDKEKKKYFKIQHPSSANAAYSSHDAKRLKLDEEREKAEEVALKKQHGRIKQSMILENPSLGGLLYRSFGQPRIDVAGIFAAGLVKQGHIPSSRGFNNNSIFAIDPRAERYGMHSEIWQGTPSGLRRLYAQLGVYHDIEFHSSTPEYRLPRGDRSRIDLPMLGVSNFHGWSLGHVTSMSVNESCRQLAVTWLSDDGTRDPDRARVYYMTKDDVHDHMLPMNIRECSPLASPRGRSLIQGDMFCSAAAPDQSPLRFAFGTTSRILTVGKETEALSTIRQSGYNNSELKDILALQFQDHNTLLVGNRRGKLYITDLRDPRFDSTASIIHHPSTITHIRTLDTYRILVAGLNSTLYQYDLRFTKADTFSLPPQPSKSPKNTLRTRPILVYDYHNSAIINIGLDVDLESGIIAAAQEYSPHHSTIQLFSLHGGHQLRSPALDAEFSPTASRTGTVGEALPIRCVRFARDVEGRPRSLYVSSSHGLIRYAWAEEEVEGAVVRYTD